MHSMRRRGSIYDRLPPRRPTQPPRSPLQFHTDCLVVEDAWLRCASGDIHSIMAADSPSLSCEFSHDHRIRDAGGHYLGISRIEEKATGEREVAALDPRRRACQLFELTLEHLVTAQQDKHWQDSRVVLQAPQGVAAEDWLDDVLMRWPIDQQPAHGVEVTSLPFDAWLAQELPCDTGKAERLQFIAIAPLCVPKVSSTPTPGETVACLWLRRVRRDSHPYHADLKEAPEATLKLMSPVWTSHESRHETPRGSSRLLDDALEALGIDAGAVKAIVWDGDRSGFRLDHLVSVLQQRFPQLFFDTDLWSAPGVGGNVQHANMAVQAVLATHLARQRQGDVLLLDSHDERQTLTLLLHREDVQ